MPSFVVSELTTLLGHTLFVENLFHSQGIFRIGLRIIELHLTKELLFLFLDATALAAHLANVAAVAVLAGASFLQMRALRVLIRLAETLGSCAREPLLAEVRTALEVLLLALAVDVISVLDGAQTSRHTSACRVLFFCISLDPVHAVGWCVLTLAHLVP